MPQERISMVVMRPEKNIYVSDAIVSCLGDDLSINELRGGNTEFKRALYQIGVKPKQPLDPNVVPKVGVLLNSACLLFTGLTVSPFQIYMDYLDGR